MVQGVTMAPKCSTGLYPFLHLSRQRTIGTKGVKKFKALSLVPIIPGAMANDRSLVQDTAASTYNPDAIRRRDEPYSLDGTSKIG